MGRESPLFPTEDFSPLEVGSLIPSLLRKEDNRFLSSSVIKKLFSIEVLNCAYLMPSCGNYCNLLLTPHFSNNLILLRK
jgi:hypothetical protein